MRLISRAVAVLCFTAANLQGSEESLTAISRSFPVLREIVLSEEQRRTDAVLFTESNADATDHWRFRGSEIETMFMERFGLRYQKPVSDFLSVASSTEMGNRFLITQPETLHEHGLDF